MCTNIACKKKKEFATPLGPSPSQSCSAAPSASSSSSTRDSGPSTGTSIVAVPLRVAPVRGFSCG